MEQAPKKHSPAFKAEVALATLLEDQTIVELVTRFEVHTTEFMPGTRP